MSEFVFQMRILTNVVGWSGILQCIALTAPLILGIGREIVRLMNIICKFICMHFYIYKGIPNTELCVIKYYV